jgi:hypothetical protein
MRTLRTLLYVAIALAVIGLGCQPKVLILNVQPSAVAAGPMKVTVNWKLSAGTGELSSDKPVVPKLVPKKPVGAQGSAEFEVCETTTFKLEPHYGGERTTTVTVAKPCGADCGQKVLTFTGTCQSALQGPNYGPQNVSASIGNGNLLDLISDADFPVHVLHLNQDIALGANGGPLLPLPAVPAAGDYQIYIPGQLGQQICADATSPVGGGPADAPEIHLTVVPKCAGK